VFAKGQHRLVPRYDHLRLSLDGALEDPIVRFVPENGQAAVRVHREAENPIGIAIMPKVELEIKRADSSQIDAGQSLGLKRFDAKGIRFPFPRQDVH